MIVGGSLGKGGPKVIDLQEWVRVREARRRGRSLRADFAARGEVDSRHHADSTHRVLARLGASALLALGSSWLRSKQNRAGAFLVAAGAVAMLGMGVIGALWEEDGGKDAGPLGAGALRSPPPPPPPRSRRRRPARRSAHRWDFRAGRA